jgi:hypothetical protein
MISALTKLLYRQLHLLYTREKGSESHLKKGECHVDHIETDIYDIKTRVFMEKDITA